MNKPVHHTKVKNWRWVYFSPVEIACKGTGMIIVDEDALDKLEKLRETIGQPFTPNSAYRSPEHNKAVGGSPNSMHLQGRAFDIPIKGKMTREVIHRVGKEVGFTGFGDYNTFVHVDTGKVRYWDKRK